MNRDRSSTSTGPVPKSHIYIEGISIEVHHKRIRNLHLRVMPQGVVRISAPKYMSIDAINVFALTKLSWIRKHQSRLQNVHPGESLKYITGEHHYVLGTKRVLELVERAGTPEISVEVNRIMMYVRPRTSTKKRHELIDAYYRQSLRAIALQMIARYEKMMGVSVAEVGIRRMKTRWGSCNIRTHRIVLNLELAKKTVECVEYIVVHEMAHLLERSHGAAFKAHMDRFFPNWKQCRKKLHGHIC